LLYLVADTPIESGLAFFRVQRVKDDSYVCSWRTLGGDGKRKTEDTAFPAKAMSGKLCVARVGVEMIVSAAEGAGNGFRELNRYSFGQGALKRVEVAAYPGQVANAVDVRVIDLQIRADALPGLAVESITRSGPPAPGSRVGQVLVGTLLAGLAIAVAAYLNHRRKFVPAATGKDADSV
jgi:hypothetical protein